MQHVHESDIEFADWLNVKSFETLVDDFSDFVFLLNFIYINLRHFLS